MKSGELAILLELTVGVDGRGISGRGQDVILDCRHCDTTSVQCIRNI